MHHAVQQPVQQSILYKPGPDLYIVDWLSWHNNTENRDQEMAGMSITMHTIGIVGDIRVCTLIEDIRAAVSEDAELQMLQEHITKG